MSQAANEDYDKWIAFHKPQLTSVGLPEALHRKLFQKLKFDDLDLSQSVKMIFNEDEERINLMAIKPLQKDSDVFLIDHAWTFRFQDAQETLMKNPSLILRLETLTEHADKQDLVSEEESKKKVAAAQNAGKPGAEESKEEEEPEKPPQLEKAMEVYAQAMQDGGVVFDLDNLDLVSLKTFEWPATTEQISLFGNQIYNPNDIANGGMTDLPTLKALWLNGNPVVDACANFDSIAELMPALEIINSRLTSLGGEWSFLFYAKAQGAKTLDQIESLNLSSKGVTNIKDASVFGKMTKLRRLDLTEHPEFFMCEERKESIEYQALNGINPDQKKSVTFVDQGCSIHEILSNLNALEELVCDMDLEMHILSKKSDKKDLLPNLKVLNGVSIDVPLSEGRKVMRRASILMHKLQMYSSSYSVQQGSASMPIWFIQDEVGSSIGHSDTPNINCVPFMYSPTNTAGDEQAQSFNIMWPTKDIRQEDGIYRDFLKGMSEENMYRSARLHTWFYTPNDYYKAGLKALRMKEANVNVEAEHDRIQLDHPLTSAMTKEQLRVYTEDKDILETLNDQKYQFCDFEEADVHWLLGMDRATTVKTANGIINQFPEDEVLLIPDLLVSLMHSTYKCFSSSEDDSKKVLLPSDIDSKKLGRVVPETYFARTQLPAFIGRFKELEENDLAPVFSVVHGNQPLSTSMQMPALSNNLDWILRLTEHSHGGTMIQKYQNRPLLYQGHKALLRFTVCVTKVVPLQAHVSRRVQVLTAPQAFTMAEPSFGDELVHVSSQVEADDTFNKIDSSEGVCYNNSVEAIKAVLKAFQVQFGEEITAKGQDNCRAIYSCDVQMNQDHDEAQVMGFGFMPPTNIDFNQCFNALFYNQVMLENEDQNVVMTPL